ncbi:MAG: endo-1,4-beta-xylanase [Sphingomicrobium sp.]
MLQGLGAVPTAAMIPSIAAAGVVQSDLGKRRIGAAIRPEQLMKGAALEPLIRRDCDLLVPEYHGHWSAVEWVEGSPYHGNYDAIVDYARATGKTVRGHSLIWQQMTPDWAKAAMARDRDWNLVRSHFASLLPRYRGKIGEWIVVNEMIDTEDGDDGIRRTSFQQAFGNDYVARALESAHEFDPDSRLMINDYSLYHDNPVDRRRRARLLRLVDSLKSAGVPLHAVGIQGHIELAKGAVAQAELSAFLRELAQMGVTLDITELDVLEDNRNADLDHRDQTVAGAIEALIDVVVDEPAVKSIVTWGLSDRDSWLQERSDATRTAQVCSPVDCNGLNRGLPYDGALRSKPMRTVLERFAA